MNPLFQKGEAFPQIGWGFCFQNELNFLGKIGDIVYPKRHGDALARAHRVNRHRES